MRGYSRLMLGLSVCILLTGLSTMMAIGGMRSVAWEGDATPTPTPVSDNPLINQYFAQADQLMCIGEFAGATEVYSQAIAADPTFILAYIYHARAYAAADLPNWSIDEILTDVETAIRLAPDSGEGYALRGSVYYAIGDYDAALADLTIALKLLPSDWLPGGYLVLGEVYQAMGKPELGLENANYALELAPQNTDTLVFLAEYYMELEDYDSALHYADTAVLVMHAQDSPSQCVLNLEDNAEILVTRGEVYSKLGEMTTAIQDFTDALTFDPANYYAYEGRGRAYVGLGQIDDALPDFFRMVELESNHTTGYGLIAAVYWMKSNYTKAIAYANRAILLAADNYEGFLYRGLGYLGIHDYAPAIADLSQAIMLNPTSAAAYQARGLARNQLGNKAEALADLKEYQRLVGNSIDPGTLNLIEQLEDELGE